MAFDVTDIGDIQDTIRAHMRRERDLDADRRAKAAGLPKGSEPPPYRHQEYPKMIYRFNTDKKTGTVTRVEKIVKHKAEDDAARKTGFGDKAAQDIPEDIA
jgi:hypothetical protein